MIHWPIFALSILNTVRLGFALLLAVVCFPIAIAQDENEQTTIRLIASGSGKAIIELKQKRYILSKSNPVEAGITLIESDSDQVILKYLDQTITLKTDNLAAAIYDDNEAPANEEDDQEPVILWANSDGFFFAKGKVNNKSIEFLVDTGASTVTFSRPQAEALGLNYRKGKDGFASTASGITPLKSLKVREISIGHIKLYDILVSVVLGNFPEVPLLGGSYLNNLNMVRVGQKMQLSKR